MMGSLRYLPRRLFIRVSPRVKWRGESTGNRAYIVGAGSLFFPSPAWTAARHAGPPRRRRRRVSFVNLCFGNPPPSLLGRPAPACDSSCYSTVIRWGDSGGGEYWMNWAQRLALAARLLAGFQRRDAVLADAPRAPLLDLGGLRGDVIAPLEALVARVVEPVGIVGAAVAPAQRRLVGRLIGRLVRRRRTCSS